MLVWLCCAVPAWAQAVDPADRNFVGRLNAAIGKAATEARDPRGAALRLCEDVSGSLLDLEAMMTTASAGTYERMSGAHREAYRTAFLRRLIRDCATNAASLMGVNVELAGVRVLRSGERIIGTRSAGAEKILIWQVRRDTAGGLMVTDVLVDGRSALLSLREQASLAIERDPGDVSALIRSLER